MIVNFPPAFPDAMDSISVEEGDVWREVGGRNYGSALPTLSHLVHRSSVDHREAMPVFAQRLPDPKLSI